MGRKKKFNLANVEDNSSIQKIEEKTKQEETNMPEEKKIDFQVFGNENIILSKIDFLDYQKISNKMLFLRYHLLGQFDEKGKYYIKDDIKKDLIKAQKEIQVEDGDGYVVHLRYAKMTFEFEVNLTYKDTTANAQLVLVEKVDEQIVKTVIDSFEEKNDEEFRINVRKRYNLVDVAFTIRDEEVPNLNIWLYWQSEEELYWHDIYEMGSQFFILRAIAILQSYGEIGANILEAYYKQLEKEQILSNNFSQMKEILDEVVNSFGGYEKIDEGKGKLGELAKEFSAPFFKKEDSKTAIIETSKPKAKAESKNAKVEDYSWRNIDQDSQAKVTATKKAGKAKSKQAGKEEKAKSKNVYTESKTEKKEKGEKQKQNKENVNKTTQPQSQPNSDELFEEINFERISGDKQISENSTGKVENSKENVYRDEGERLLNEEVGSGSGAFEKI